jgi:uncharacterized coiled-coil protein SlyX
VASPERSAHNRRRGDQMTDQVKTQADQVEEIAKLVQDAQDKLDQVSRALRMLENRVRTADRDRDEPD